MPELKRRRVRPDARPAQGAMNKNAETICKDRNFRQGRKNGISTTRGRSVSPVRFAPSIYAAPRHRALWKAAWGVCVRGMCRSELKIKELPCLSTIRPQHCPQGFIWIILDESPQISKILQSHRGAGEDGSKKCFRLLGPTSTEHRPDTRSRSRRAHSVPEPSTPGSWGG